MRKRYIDHGQIMIAQNTDFNEDKQGGKFERLQRKTLAQFQKTEAQINIEKKESLFTKLLHFITFLFELFGFFAATLAIVLINYASTLLFTAAILGIISNINELLQLSMRITRVEGDKKELQELVNILERYRIELEKNPYQKLECPASNSSKDLIDYLIQQPELLKWANARNNRDEINSRKLFWERLVSIASILTNLVIALILTKEIASQIELLLLTLIVIDKFTHFIFAKEKTKHAAIAKKAYSKQPSPDEDEGEKNPLLVLKNKLEHYNEGKELEQKIPLELTGKEELANKGACYFVNDREGFPAIYRDRESTFIKKNGPLYEIFHIPNGKKEHDWENPILVHNKNKNTEELIGLLDKLATSTSNSENLRQNNPKLMQPLDKFIELNSEHVISKDYFAKKLDYTTNRVPKRKWKVWVRRFELTAAAIAFLTAGFLMLCQLHWIHLTITALHPAIKSFVYGAMAIDGLTTVTWTGYQGYRYAKKRGLFSPKADEGQEGKHVDNYVPQPKVVCANG